MLHFHLFAYKLGSTGKVVASTEMISLNKTKDLCEKLGAHIINFRFMLTTYNIMSKALFALKQYCGR